MVRGHPAGGTFKLLHGGLHYGCLKTPLKKQKAPPKGAPPKRMRRITKKRHHIPQPSTSSPSPFLTPGTRKRKFSDPEALDIGAPFFPPSSPTFGTPFLPPSSPRIGHTGVPRASRATTPRKKLRKQRKQRRPPLSPDPGLTKARLIREQKRRVMKRVHGQEAQLQALQEEQIQRVHREREAKMLAEAAGPGRSPSAPRQRRVPARFRD